jgi:hypothetical protein
MSARENAALLPNRIVRAEAVTAGQACRMDRGAGARVTSFCQIRRHRGFRELAPLTEFSKRSPEGRFN